ncbi:MAG: phage holin family protein [Candidatus Pacebacteria bacterium]|nr:phage holin family protein [Candidatus Paceibacterota bacterium]
MKLFLTWFISTVALLISAWLIPGAKINSFWSALLVALMLGIVNAVIRPVLVFLTLPINILTLGFFTLIINGLMVWLVAIILPGFSISSFWVAIIFSVILALITWIIEGIIK